MVLITLDTTRADVLGAYGGAAWTPHLDALALEAVRFTRHTSVAPTTLASHTALMTGTPPHRHGAASNGFRVAEANVLLAERLRDAGFTTAAFLGAMPLGSHTGFTQGFSHVDEDFGRERGAEFEQAERAADEVTDAALAWVADHRAERLFLFVHYFDPHAPYDPPPAWRARAGVENPELGRLPHLGRVRHRSRVGDVDPAETAALAALYRAEIAWTDAQLGRLLAGLGELGVGADALVVVTADHGEALAEREDHWNHGRTVYQEAIHTPLIVKLPGGTPGIEGAVVSNVDVAPTVVDVLGLDLPTAHGQSFADALRGRPLGARGPAFAEATRPEVAEGPWRNARNRRMVRVGDDVLHFDTAGFGELYDLATDPGEAVDLLSGRTTSEVQARARALWPVLTAWSASADPLPTRPLTDPGIRAMLEGLGYAE